MALTLVRNVALNTTATLGRTATVCEPTMTGNGNQLMATGNWFAAKSANNGGAWAHVDPFTTFPASAGGFCCDQIVQYNARHGIWIWLLQYIQGPGGNNIFRIAISRAATFGSWYYWSFSPVNLDQSWTNMWFDYPDMATTDDNLYVSFNAFVGNGWKRAFVFRFPLATLASGASLGYRWWTTTTNGSLRLTRGARHTMYFGSHNSLSQIRVFQWPDAATAVTSTNVNVHAWKGGPYSAPGPDGHNWLGRLDQRITGAWVGSGTIGFMWSANTDPSHPKPYIRVVRMNETTKAVVNEPDIWSQTAAWAYPAAAANGQGQVGLSAFYGGGPRHPSHVVGAGTGTSWATVFTRIGTNGPVDNAWGDYLSCLAHQNNSTHWVASGYTLQGGSDRSKIEPRYVEFHA
jgi:hypothetical protein